MKFIKRRLSALVLALATINPLPVVSTAALSLSAMAPTSIASVTVIATGTLMLSVTQVKACGDGSCDPEPPTQEPPKPEPKPEHESKDDLCSRGDEASVKRSVGDVSEGDMVTRLGGQIIKLGGDWTVVKVLPGRNVCVVKEKPVTKVAPAAQKRQCDEAEAQKNREVCPDLYVGGKAD